MTDVRCMLLVGGSRAFSFTIFNYGFTHLKTPVPSIELRHTTSQDGARGSTPRTTARKPTRRHIRTLNGGAATHSSAAEGSFGFLMSFLPPRGAALAVSVAEAPDALGA